MSSRVTTPREFALPPMTSPPSSMRSSGLSFAVPYAAPHFLHTRPHLPTRHCATSPPATRRRLSRASPTCATTPPPLDAAAAKRRPPRSPPHLPPSRADTRRANLNSDEADDDTDVGERRRSEVDGDDEGIRVNKCFKSFASRRESDAFIRARRVTINDKVARPGARVRPSDTVCLDGRPIDWQRLVLDADVDAFVYLKHWKPVGDVSTTDPAITQSVTAQIDGRQPASLRAVAPGDSDRVFPVGKLDDSATGLTLLTSDGRLPNAILGGGAPCEKTYVVTPDVYVSDEHVASLCAGVEIRQDLRRPGQGRRGYSSPNAKWMQVVTRTPPCHIARGEDSQLVITVSEGRNRQIRIMLEALGYTATLVHRAAFMGITLDGLSGPGDTCPLTEDEMKIVKDRLRDAGGQASSAGGEGDVDDQHDADGQALSTESESDVDDEHDAGVQALCTDSENDVDDQHDDDGAT